MEPPFNPCNTKPLTFIRIVDTWTPSTTSATLNLLYSSGLLTSGAPLQPAVYEPLAGVAGETNKYAFYLTSHFVFYANTRHKERKSRVSKTHDLTHEKKNRKYIKREPVDLLGSITRYLGSITGIRYTSR